jgi:hypothetical protein
MNRLAAASAIEANAACRGGQQQDLGTKRRGLDREARLTISAELGHEREQITAVYLGR